MDSNTDALFAPSLLSDESSRAQDFDIDMSGMDGSMQQPDQFFEQAYTTDPLDEFLFTSPRPSPAPLKEQDGVVERVGAERKQALVSSPEDSVQDSSSEGSRRHKCKSPSTGSSGSGRSGLDMTISNTNRPGTRLPTTYEQGSQLSFNFDPSIPITQKLENIDFSNAQMSSHFDFDSAASSPSPVITSNNALAAPTRFISIPYRESSGSAASFAPQNRSSTVSFIFSGDAPSS